MMGHTLSSVSIAQTKQPVIQVKKGKLTANVNNVPLIKVLESIADQTGIGFELYGKEERKITIKYTDIPLADGLKRTLRPYNHIILYTKKRSQSEKPRILKVIVYDQDGKDNGQAVRRDPIELMTRKSQVRNDRVSSTILDDTVEKVSLEEYATQLKDPDPDVREEAISDMADEYEAEALIYLEMALLHDGNSDVRSAAAEEIGDLENVLGIDVLARGLKDPDEDVREAVVGALGNIGGKGTLPVLRRALKDRNKDIRDEAADLIEEIEEELAN
jgi:hypothetical protein